MSNVTLNHKSSILTKGLYTINITKEYSSYVLKLTLMSIKILQYLVYN